MTDIPERDWRVFRELRTSALERFCERALREIGDISARTGQSWHQRYLDTYKLLDHRDNELVHAFDGNSRSKAIYQLAAIHSHGLLMQQEFDRFTAETRERIQAICDLSRDR